jgi:hypothetical protein
VLPLKPNMLGSSADGSAATPLLHRFSDLQPQLLLFLQRLRRIVVTHAPQGMALVMEKSEEGPCLMRLTVTRISTSGAGQGQPQAGQEAVPQVVPAAAAVEAQSCEDWLLIKWVADVDESSTYLHVHHLCLQLHGDRQGHRLTITN